MKRILIPTDFSDVSLNACMYAIEFLKKQGEGEIRLVHCFYDMLIDSEIPPVTGLDPNTRITERILHRNEEEAKKDLATFTKRVEEKVNNGNLSITVSSEFVWGMPPEAVIEAAHKCNANLIVMGVNDHRDDYLEKLFGTVTSSVISETDIPVLAIPRNAKFTGVSSVMYATDYYNEDEQSIKNLKELVSSFNPVIFCVHVTDEDHLKEDKTRLNEFRDKMVSKSMDTTIKFDIVEEDDILTGLETYTLVNKIDIIACTTHQRGFFSRIFNPSETKEILFHTTIPLLVFGKRG